MRPLRASAVCGSGRTAIRRRPAQRSSSAPRPAASAEAQPRAPRPKPTAASATEQNFRSFGKRIEHRGTQETPRSAKPPRPTRRGSSPAPFHNTPPLPTHRQPHGRTMECRPTHGTRQAPSPCRPPRRRRPSRGAPAARRCGPPAQGIPRCAAARHGSSSRPRRTATTDNRPGPMPRFRGKQPVFRPICSVQTTSIKSVRGSDGTPRHKDENRFFRLLRPAAGTLPTKNEPADASQRIAHTDFRIKYLSLHANSTI